MSHRGLGGGVHEELSVTSSGSAIIGQHGGGGGGGGGGGHPGSRGKAAPGPRAAGKRNLTVTRRNRGGHGHGRGTNYPGQPNAPSMSGYGRGQFNMLDTNDADALEQAAAILANDDFLQAATLSSSGQAKTYGAPSVLFSAPIRPNSPSRGSTLPGSNSMATTTTTTSASGGGGHRHGLVSSASAPGFTVPATTTGVGAGPDDDGQQLWAERTRRTGGSRGNKRGGGSRGGSRSTSNLLVRGHLDDGTGGAHHAGSKLAATDGAGAKGMLSGIAEKTDADHGGLKYGAGETPLAVSRSVDGTWHQVGIVAAPYERPVTRREVLALEHRYAAICEFARLASKGNMPKPSAQGGGGGGDEHQEANQSEAFADLLEQELMNTKQEMLHLFGPLTGPPQSATPQGIAAAAAVAEGAALPEEGIDSLRPEVTATVFEQKWTDMVLGELQEQIGVTCMEQGRLLFALRRRYAQAFNTMQDAHQDACRRLARSREQRERLGEALVETKSELGVYEEAARDAREKAVDEMRSEMQEEVDGERRKAQEARHQQERTQDTLRTLNGIFLQMRQDTEGARVADLRDAVSTMERRLYEREKELTELRPMRAGHDEMTETIATQSETIVRLEKELQSAKDDLAMRDAMVADLMRQQGELLSQKEVNAVNGTGGGGAGGGAPASAAAAAGGGATTPMGQPVPAAAVRVEGLVKDVDKLLGGTVKKRLPCAGYRILLPNLMGYRPERPRRWTLRCMRAIMRAKQADDSRCERNQRLRARFPDFVYAWFEPPLHALAAAESGEAREAMMADADEDRWGLYYGVKALSRELPEARLFYNFLDEKYGEDELTFFLYCLRVLDAEAWRPGNGGIDWGRPYWMTPMNHATLEDKSPDERRKAASALDDDDESERPAPTSLSRINAIYRRQKEDGVEEDDEDDEDLRASDPDGFCPTVVFVTQATVAAVVDVVMKRAGAGTNTSKEVRAAMLRQLCRKTAAVQVGRLPESVHTVTKRKLVKQLHMLESDVQARQAAMRGEQDDDGGSGKRKKNGGGGEEKDAFAALLDEHMNDDEQKEEERRFAENVHCVEAGGLLRGLLQEYREEQAHRRAAIRLMFQTATNPGADAAADIADDLDGAGARVAPAPAAIDMQQFRSVCESLHARVPFREVVQLYRDAYELGGGGKDSGGSGKGMVDFDSFSTAADNRQFFSACLRLPAFVGAAERNQEQMSVDNIRVRIAELKRLASGVGGAGDDDGFGDSAASGGSGANPQQSMSTEEAISTSFSVAECTRLAAVVTRHVKLFEATVEDHYLAKWLTGDARVRVQQQLEALREDVRVSCLGTRPDGRRALCAYRRLLDALMFERMERLQTLGDNKVAGESTGSRLDRIDRELDVLETVLREFTVAPGVLKLRRVMRFIAVIRIQRCWRSFLARSDGVPLSLRPMMTKDFAAPEPDSLRPRSEGWLLQQLDTVYHEKLMTDARSDASRLPRTPFPEFLYDHHLYKYGVRSIAEKMLHTLFFNVRRHCKTNSRGRLFALQMGMGDELKLSIESRFKAGSDSSSRAARQAALMIGADMTPEHWMETRFAHEFYLRVLVALAGSSTVNRGCLFPHSRSEEGTGKTSLPAEQVCQVLTENLSHDHAGANIHFTENELVVLCNRIKDLAAGGPRVDVDDVLELVMCRWTTKMRDREVDLRKIFRAGDVDLNSVLSFGEWWFSLLFSSQCFLLLLTAVLLF